jgi:hypothetical protein
MAEREVPEAVLTGAEMAHPTMAAGGEVAPGRSHRDPEEFLMGAVP